MTDNNETMLLGIDVSEHNGVVDWMALKAWGVQFAILRLGYGRGHLDGRFYENINGTIAAGIPAGMYYYSYALTEEEARNEAWFTQYVLQDSGVTPELLPMGVWFDMEDADGWKAARGMPDSPVITSMCDIYMKEMQRAGYRSGVYASYDWLTHHIQTEKLSPYTSYWCAQWGNRCDFPSFDMWQYTDSLWIQGKVFDGNWSISSQ